MSEESILSETNLMRRYMITNTTIYNGLTLNGTAINIQKIFIISEIILDTIKSLILFFLKIAAGNVKYNPKNNNGLK